MAAYQWWPRYTERACRWHRVRTMWDTGVKGYRRVRISPLVDWCLVYRAWGSFLPSPEEGCSWEASPGRPAHRPAGNFRAHTSTRTIYTLYDAARMAHEEARGRAPNPSTVSRRHEEKRLGSPSQSLDLPTESHRFCLVTYRCTAQSLHPRAP